MKKKLLVLGLLVLILVSVATASITSARDAICQILGRIYRLLQYIAAGVAVVVIVLQGVKWTGSADDPGARKQAKQGVIHAIVGLIIVLIAIWVVYMIFTADKCPTSVYGSST